ncbi:hypothetical protein PVK06_013101 [Gossypium arboreum]|uniref:Uncharacterized protein n=1 Tax=Gossypium arboreum TaxID=29729 RepID=A0ABR0QE12_GOSAR|nr:hypothetical protein PVK06_013101 [Gossypium arboreum]
MAKDWYVKLLFVPRTTNMTADTIAKEVRRHTMRLLVFAQPIPMVHDAILQDKC